MWAWDGHGSEWAARRILDNAAMNAPDALARLIARQMSQTQGWMGFDRFMALALCAPGTG